MAKSRPNFIGFDKNRRLVIGSRYATADEERQIKADAQLISKTVLWQILIDTANEVATKGIFNNTSDWDKVQYYRAMHDILAMQANMLAALTVPDNPQPTALPVKRKRVQ